MIGENLCYFIVFFAEGLIAWQYMFMLFEAKNGNGLLCLSSSVCYMTLYVISRQIDNMAVNGLAFMAGNLFLLYFNYSRNIRTCFLHSLYMSLIMILTEFLPAILLSAVFGDYTAYTYRFSAMISLAVLSKMLYFWLMVLSTKIFHPVQRKEEKTKPLLLFCVLPAASLVVIVTYVYICMATTLSAASEILVVISALFLLLSNIMLFVLYFHVQKINSENLEMQLMFQKEKADAEYYAMLQEQYDKQRILIHDIKNHMQVMQTLLRQNSLVELEQYLVEVTASSALQKMMRICDNPILNMLLIQYRTICQQNDIDFHCDIREHSIDFLNATEITALFGNLLSNAVEAAQHAKDKRIEISVQYRLDQKIVMVILVNSCETVPIQDQQGNFLTHKLDRQNHGIGLKSVQRVIKKHQGASKYYYDPEQKQFHSIILFQR